LSGLGLGLIVGAVLGVILIICTFFIFAIVGFGSRRLCNRRLSRLRRGWPERQRLGRAVRGMGAGLL